MKALQERIARKYAKALLELSDATNLEQRRDSLAQFAADLHSVAHFRGALVSPATPLPQRNAALSHYLSFLRPGDSIFANFALTLLQAGRIEIVPVIAKVFAEMIASLQKIMTLHISSAFLVPDEEKHRLLEQVRKEIPQNYASMLQAEWHHDKELIGGIVVRSGDKLLDGSVRGALERVTHAAQA